MSLTIGNVFPAVPQRRPRGALVVLALVLFGCGSGEVTSQVAGATVSNEAGPDDRPVVAVTTNILGNVVENLVGDSMDVVVVMPIGSDPHEFQPSAQQIAQVAQADAVIANGANFEEGLLDVIEAALDDGIPVFEAISAVDTLDFADEDDHDDHDDDDHDDDDHDDDDHDAHGHEGVDPHFFTDPARMAVASEAIVDFLVMNTNVEESGLRDGAGEYVARLEALDDEVEQTLANLSDGERVLLTNHEVFGYFADRYDFEVVGTVIPATSTGGGTSAQQLVELAEIIEHEGVAAIFADTSSSDALAVTLAEEVGDVAVVELFSESLGVDGSGGETYLELVRSNAERISTALGE